MTTPTLTRVAHRDSDAPEYTKILAAACRRLADKLETIR